MYIGDSHNFPEIASDSCLMCDYARVINFCIIIIYYKMRPNYGLCQDVQHKPGPVATLHEPID